MRPRLLAPLYAADATLKRGSTRLARWLEDPSPRRRMWLTVIAAVMFAVVLGLRFSTGREGSAWLILLIFPLALVALEYGALGASLSAMAAVGAFIVWAGIGGEGEVTVLEHLVRLVGFTLAGGLLGLLADAGRELRTLADRDPLTGLLNRRRFTEAIESHAAEVRRYGGGYGALIYLDLDNFKKVNDTLGHAVGDELLKQVAEVLRGRVRASDCLARLGGDEFAVLLPHAGEREARQAARAIIREVGERDYEIDGNLLRVSTSVGVAPFDPQDGERALEAADRAMYAAKRSGGGAYRLPDAGDAVAFE